MRLSVNDIHTQKKNPKPNSTADIRCGALNLNLRTFHFCDSSAWVTTPKILLTAEETSRKIP